MRVAICVILAAIFVVSTMADEDRPSPTKPASPQMPIPTSGREIFTTYCAACHGLDARGDGPVASAFNTPPADLTLLSRRNGGKYPVDRVTSVLRGEALLVAHGNRDMPVWGPVFSRLSEGRGVPVRTLITNLNHYLESMQRK